MLEFIRRRSTSFLSWLILGAIAIIFGLQFGLPSDSLSVAPGSLAEVHGEEIRSEDFQFQIGLASRFGLVPKEAQMREIVGVNEELVDGMVERILLADAPLSPLRLGRQPDESDRRPLNDCRATER